jgi:hypothetical protein
MRPESDSGADANPLISTSRAARVAASEALSESVAVVTPSHTTSTHAEPGADSAPVAAASSLRECKIPRSETAATHAAGCSST